jgi:TolB protein
MKKEIRFGQMITVLALVVFLAPASRMFGEEINISVDYIPGREKPIPLAISGFSGEAEEVIRFALTIQGFSFNSPDSAQYILSGSNDANLVGRAQDRINRNYVVNKSYSGGSVRRQAHVFVDDFLAALGRKGIGSTKIAFKKDTGANSEICIADFDGGGAQTVTSDNAIVISPSWIPGRLGLCYTSYRNGAPDIYQHDLTTGRRTPVARYPGSNLSPSVSPDGRRVAMILSRSGTVDLYVGDIDGGNLKRLTKSREDESSPTWSPDGQWICFAGKKDERRSLWKVSASGGEPVRIATGVANPSEPDWSPDGKWIVFTSQRGGGFDVCVVAASGGSATVLVEGEDPSWAPNSRTVVYARRSGKGKTLSMLDVPTKQTKTVSRISGKNSQPSWAK